MLQTQQRSCLYYALIYLFLLSATQMWMNALLVEMEFSATPQTLNSQTEFSPVLTGTAVTSASVNLDI